MTCECCKNLPWYTATAEELEHAQKKFNQWFPANYGPQHLGSQSMSKLYGTPLIEKCAMIYSAGRDFALREKKACDCLRGKCWEKFVEFTKTNPDLFRSYAFISERSNNTCLEIFLYGYFSV